MTCAYTDCFIECITEAPAANRRVFGDTIVVHNAQASDSAVYQCEASNKYGTLLSNANIMIMSKYDCGVWATVFLSLLSLWTATFIKYTKIKPKDLLDKVFISQCLQVKCQTLQWVTGRLLTDVSSQRAAADAGICP